MRQTDNIPICKEAFELQTQIATGAVTPEMMAEIGGKFGTYFASTTSWEVPSEGIVGSGSFMDMMAVLSPIWMGLVNTECVNVSFLPVKGGAVARAEAAPSRARDRYRSQWRAGTARKARRAVRQGRRSCARAHAAQ